jgi:hypothetical protein
VPRGVITRPGKFQRNPHDYHAVAVISQVTGKWELISRRPFGYVVLCPNFPEAQEMVRYCGPRMGFHSPSGYIDDEYEKWVRQFLVIQHYGRPKGVGEMLYAEFTRGWYPGEDLLNAGRRSSPGITDGVIEPQYENIQPSVVASAISASMGY